MWQMLSNRRVWLVATAAAALTAMALWPATVAVETEPVLHTPLLVTIDDEGVTRVRDVFVVSAPVAGRVQRIEVEPGDTVRAGQVLTFLRPELSPLLDAQTRVDLSAAVIAARANVERARAQRQQAVDVLAHTRRERDRARDLLEGGLETRQHLDAREADVQAGAAAADAALHAVEAAEADLQRAAARLTPPRPQAAGRPVAVTAPVAGVVLRRLRESESVVPGGDALLHLGDPSRLEIVVDLLSTEAVRVVPGARVLVEQWGGAQVLEARVRRVEPAGFTKVSALGVEEQRVNVLCDFVDPRTAWAALGDAFRVEVRIVQWEAPSVLTVPASALFRAGDGWSAFAVRDGRARLTAVQTGQRTSQRVEVLGGLAEHDIVVVYPGDAVHDGARVAMHTSR